MYEFNTKNIKYIKKHEENCVQFEVFKSVRKDEFQLSPSCKASEGKDKMQVFKHDQTVLWKNKF